MKNLKKNDQIPTFEQLQKWYDQANWYGEANTFLGTLTSWGIRNLQRQYYQKEELEYNCPA